MNTSPSPDAPKPEHDKKGTPSAAEIKLPPVPVLRKDLLEPQGLSLTFKDGNLALPVLQAVGFRLPEDLFELLCNHLEADAPLTPDVLQDYSYEYPHLTIEDFHSLEWNRGELDESRIISLWHSEFESDDLESVLFEDQQLARNVKAELLVSDDLTGLKLTMYWLEDAPPSQAEVRQRWKMIDDVLWAAGQPPAGVDLSSTVMSSEPHDTSFVSLQLGPVQVDVIQRARPGADSETHSANADPDQETTPEPDFDEDFPAPAEGRISTKNLPKVLAAKVANLSGIDFRPSVFVHMLEVLKPGLKLDMDRFLDLQESQRCVEVGRKALFSFEADGLEHWTELRFDDFESLAGYFVMTASSEYDPSGSQLQIDFTWDTQHPRFDEVPIAEMRAFCAPYLCAASDEEEELE